MVEQFAFSPQMIRKLHSVYSTETFRLQPLISGVATSHISPTITFAVAAFELANEILNAAHPPTGRGRYCSYDSALGLVLSQPFSVQPNSRLGKVTNQGFIAGLCLAPANDC